MIELYFTLRIAAFFVVFAIGAVLFLTGLIGYLTDRRKKNKRR